MSAAICRIARANRCRLAIPCRMSALARTIYDAKPEVFRLLLAKGADIESKDQWGDTPLMRAVGGNPEVVKMLLEKGADVNVRNLEGETPLMQAYQEENIIALLNKRADINAQDNKGYTALIHAITQYNLEKVKILLDHGADKNIKTRNGRTALQIAGQFATKEQVVKMLMEVERK